MDAPAEPRIVSAVLTACSSLDGNDALAKEVEAAMAQAVKDCLARGVSIEDSPTIKAAILEARHRVRAAHGLPYDGDEAPTVPEPVS